MTVGDSNPLLQLVQQELVLSVQIQLMPLICRYLLGSASYQHSKKIRAPAPGPWHCRRPSVVTEGYIRSPPLPRTHLLLTYLPPVDSGSPPTHDYRCNLQCILRVVFKKHRFLQGFGPFGGAELHLGDVKKCGFFHSFCFEGRKKS